MKKNLLSFLLLAFLCAVGLQVSAQTYSGVCGDNVNWSLDAETGVLEISGNGAITSAGWHEYASSISSVVIAEGVTSVPAKLFEYSETITAVLIPTTVESIGTGAFSCAVIENMTVAEGNAVYDSRENCNAIIETATNKLISGCKNTVIPNSVESIGDEAFYWCEVLTSLEIPSSVTAIGSSAFAACSTLVELALPEGLTEISHQLFDDCVSLKRVVVSSTVTSIGDYAFDNCGSLNGIVMLPSGAPEVSSSSFRDCSSSLVLYYNNDSEGYNEIASTYGIKALDVAENTFYFYESDGLPGAVVDGRHVWESSKIEYDVPVDGVRLTFLASDEYDYNGIPRAVIAELEFFDGAGEKMEYTAEDVSTNSLEIKENSSIEALCDGNVASFYHSAWSNEAENIRHGSQLVYLEILFEEPVSSFSFKCTGRGEAGYLKELLPENICVTVAGFKAEPLSSGVCGEEITWSFDEETGILTFEGSGALDGEDGYKVWRNQIEKIVVSEGITEIGNYAFSGYIEVPNFRYVDGCPALKSVQLPASLTSIGDYAFYKCAVLESIELPSNLTSIGEYAFSECHPKKVIIPSAVTNIEASAFYGCSSLRSAVMLPSEAPEVGSNAFGDCDSSLVLYYNSDSEGYEAIANSCGIKALNVAENTYYLNDNDGLPGTLVDGHLVWESPIMEFSAPVDGVRFTYMASGEYDSNGIPLAAIAELELFDATGNKIEYTAADVSTNSLEFNDGSSLEALCDGDAETFYHSAWSSNSQNILHGTELVYLEITFPEPVTSFSFKHTGRNSSNYLKHLLPELICITPAYFEGVLPTSGSCGDEITWSFDKETGTLTFVGNGVLASSDYMAWNRKVNKVVVGEGITAIGSQAFENFSVLKEIEIPGTVTSIGNHAFEYCRVLKSLEFPEKLTEIGSYAFRDCDILENFEFPSCLLTIRDRAFAGCDALTSIEIPGSVTSIGLDAFAACDALEGIVVAEGNTVYDSRENCNAIIETATNTLVIGCKNTTVPADITTIASRAFYDCDGLTNMELPAGLTSLGSYSFYDCDGLTSIEIPESVTSIGDFAFFGCGALQTVVSNCIVAPELGIYAFNNMSSSAVLCYPACCDYTAWEGFFASTEAVGTVQEGTCGENLTWYFNEGIGLLRISGTGVMYDYDNESSPQPWRTLGVNTVLMDEGVENIGNYAFYNCTALTRIEIPEGVTSIGDYTFYNCSSLTSIEIPATVTRIGISASYLNYAPVFSGCSSLAAVHINDLAAWCRIDFGDAGYATANPLFYAHNLYLNGKLITELVIPDEITEIKPFTFGGAGITSVTIHENVTEIGQDAFKRCTALSNVVIPDGVTIIGKGAFYYCTALESVAIGAGVTTVGEGAFSGCGSLNAVHISDLSAWCGIDFQTPNNASNPIVVAGNLYLNGEAVTDLVIPEDVTVIKPRAFKGLAGLKNVTMHKGVTAIGSEAFSGCPGIESITSWIPAGILFEIGENVFGDVNKFECLLFVPYAAGSAYSSTAGWDTFENVIEMDPTEIVIKVNQYGSGTFCFEYPLDFSAVEGLKAYVAGGYNVSTNVITLMRVNSAKAGVGLFIKGEPGEYVVPVLEESYDNYLNMLVGTTEVTTVNSTSADGLYYNFKYTILSGDTEPKFYRFADGSRYSAGKAYLQIPASWLSSSSNTIGMRFDDELATGIDDVNDGLEGENGEMKTVYDLQGRRVEEPSKGIYIINGKKVLIK